MTSSLFAKEIALLNLSNLTEMEKTHQKSLGLSFHNHHRFGQNKSSIHTVLIYRPSLSPLRLPCHLISLS